MEKRLQNISHCRVGDVLAQEVYNRNGTMLVPKGVVVCENLLKRLVELGVFSLWIYPRKADDGSVRQPLSYEEIERLYQQDVDRIKDIIQDLALGKPLDMGQVQDISDSLYIGIHEKQSIIRCISTLKAFDQYTYNHSVNVALYCMLLAQWLQLSEPEIKEATKAGLLHDIGKANVAEHILNKRGKLTQDEYEAIKLHPIYGYNMARNVQGISEDILKAIVMHHEREDGNGYPFRVNGKQMSNLAKIVAIADSYDAITSERVYKRRITPFDTFKIMWDTGCVGFDVQSLITFLNNIANYYIGAEVVLNTGERGAIIHIVPSNISRPIIKVDNYYIDLGKNDGLNIISLAE